MGTLCTMREMFFDVSLVIATLSSKYTMSCVFRDYDLFFFIPYKKRTFSTCCFFTFPFSRAWEFYYKE